MHACMRHRGPPPDRFVGGDDGGKALDLPQARRQPGSVKNAAMGRGVSALRRLSDESRRSGVDAPGEIIEEGARGAVVAQW